MVFLQFLAIFWEPFSLLHAQRMLLFGSCHLHFGWCLQAVSALVFDGKCNVRKKGTQCSLYSGAAPHSPYTASLISRQPSKFTSVGNRAYVTLNRQLIWYFDVPQISFQVWLRSQMFSHEVQTSCTDWLRCRGQTFSLISILPQLPHQHRPSLHHLWKMP